MTTTTISTIPLSGGLVIQPLLDLALAQTNGQGAYVYRLEPGEPEARLAAWAGLPLDRQNLRASRKHLERSAAIVVPERASSDSRFQHLPEFRGQRFEAVVSIPLQDGGEVVGIANFCRTRPGALPARDLSFLLSLGLPLGALLNAEAVREQLARTTQLLADRKLLARAKGVLQDLGWSEEESYLHIRRLSRQNRTPMREIARQVIEAGESQALQGAAYGD